MDTSNAQLALDVICDRGKTDGPVPIWLINPMEWRMIDRLAGDPEGTYEQQPRKTYLKMLQALVEGFHHYRFRGLRP